MRLWSLHPRYLDRQGLTACWREALLAQAVLAGRTRGYRHHPQLRRFQGEPEPLAVIGAYLDGLAAEATLRGYHYDLSRILRPPAAGEWEGTLEVTSGQLDYEWRHLAGKLSARSPQWLATLDGSAVPGGRGTVPHPLFRVVGGPVADWEVV